MHSPAGTMKQPPFSAHVVSSKAFGHGAVVYQTDPFSITRIVLPKPAIATIPYGIAKSNKMDSGRHRASPGLPFCGICFGKKPLSLLIPCRRVIRNAGEIGPFGGGHAMKKQLLALKTGAIAR